MIRIIGLEQREEWDVIVRSFEHFDVYYLSGYVHAFMLHGDGIPIWYMWRKVLLALCRYI